MRLLDSRILLRGRLRETAKGKRRGEPVQLGALVELQGPSDSRRTAKGTVPDAAGHEGKAVADRSSGYPLRREYSFSSRMRLHQDQKQKEGEAKWNTGDLEGRGTVTVELGDAGAEGNRATGAGAHAAEESQQHRSAPQKSSNNVTGTISGRLLQPYRRREAEEALIVSEQLPGCEAWRVLPELQRLLVLRGGRLCCRQRWGRAQQEEEEEDCMRQCLARLAVLKTDIAASASQLLQREAEASAVDATAGRLTGGGAAGVLLAEKPAAAVALRAPAQSQQQQPLTQEKQRLQLCRRVASTGETSSRFLNSLLDALELATAYATRGKTHPAVYLQIAALRPALIYEVLARWQVQLVFLHVFQRLWLHFAAYSIRRGVRVSSALLVLDFSGLTQAECTSSAMHWLLTDLRKVLKACCPLLVQSIVFSGCQLARQYLWEILRPVLDIDIVFITVCETPEELAAQVEAARPFVYHQLLDAAYGSDTLHEWLPYVAAMPEVDAGYKGSSNGSRAETALLQVPVPADACTDSGTAWLDEAAEDLLQLLLDRQEDAASAAPAAASERTAAGRLLRAQFRKARDAAAATATAAAGALTETSVRIVQLAALALVPVLCRDRQERQAEQGEQHQTLLQQECSEWLQSPPQQTQAYQERVQTRQFPERDVPSSETVQQIQAVVRRLWLSLEHRESCCFWQVLQALEEGADATQPTTKEQLQMQGDRTQQQHFTTEKGKAKRALGMPRSRPELAEEKRRSSWLQPHGVAKEFPDRTDIRTGILSPQRSADGLQREQQQDLAEAARDVRAAACSSFSDFLQSLDQAVVAVASDSWHRRRVAAGLSTGISSFQVNVKGGAAKHERRLLPLDLDNVARPRVSFRSLVEPVL